MEDGTSLKKTNEKLTTKDEQNVNICDPEEGSPSAHDYSDDRSQKLDGS